MVSRRPVASLDEAPGPWPWLSRVVDQKKLPMVISKTIESSPGRRPSGMPHSKRSGPIGENQRKPKPTDVRRFEKMPPMSDVHGSADDAMLVCAPRAHQRVSVL